MKLNFFAGTTEVVFVGIPENRRTPLLQLKIGIEMDPIVREPITFVSDEIRTKIIDALASGSFIQNVGTWCRSARLVSVEVDDVVGGKLIEDSDEIINVGRAAVNNLDEFEVRRRNCYCVMGAIEEIAGMNPCRTHTIDTIRDEALTPEEQAKMSAVPLSDGGIVPLSDGGMLPFLSYSGDISYCEADTENLLRYIYGWKYVDHTSEILRRTGMTAVEQEIFIRLNDACHVPFYDFADILTKHSTVMTAEQLARHKTNIDRELVR